MSPGMVWYGMVCMYIYIYIYSIYIYMYIRMGLSIPWFIIIFPGHKTAMYVPGSPSGRSPSYPEHMSLRGGSDDVCVPERNLGWESKWLIDGYCKESHLTFGWFDYKHPWIVWVPRLIKPCKTDDLMRTNWHIKSTWTWMVKYSNDAMKKHLIRSHPKWSKCPRRQQVKRQCSRHYMDALPFPHQPLLCEFVQE